MADTSQSLLLAQSQSQTKTHKRGSSIWETIFSGPKVSLSSEINSAMIVDRDKPGEEDLYYVRLYSEKNDTSLITTKELWSPPPVVFFSMDPEDPVTDKPVTEKSDLVKRLESPYFPIAIDITKSNIKFPDLVLDNTKGKKVKIYFVVQTGGNGQALQGVRAFVNNKDAEKISEAQPPSWNTPYQRRCKIEIFRLNSEKIKCKHAKTISIGSNPQDSKELETKDIEETLFSCYFAGGIKTDRSPVVIEGLESNKTEHFISKITSDKNEVIITYLWIIPLPEFFFLNEHIGNPLFLEPKCTLATLMKKFESIKDKIISEEGIPNCPSFLLDPFEFLKAKLEFIPIKEVTSPTTTTRLRSPSYSPSLSASSRDSELISPSRKSSGDSGKVDLNSDKGNPKKKPRRSKKKIKTGTLSEVVTPSIPTLADSTEVIIQIQRPLPAAPSKQAEAAPLRQNKPPIPLHPRRSSAAPHPVPNSGPNLVTHSIPTPKDNESKQKEIPKEPKALANPVTAQPLSIDKLRPPAPTRPAPKKPAPKKPDAISSAPRLSMSKPAPTRQAPRRPESPAPTPPLLLSGSNNGSNNGSNKDKAADPILQQPGQRRSTITGNKS